MFGESAVNDAIRSTRTGDIRGGQGIRTAVSLHAELLRLCSEPTPLVIRLADVDSIDASTIQLLLAAKRDLGESLKFEIGDSADLSAWLKLAGAEAISSSAL
ncbi:hypothetical protein SH449x_000328 [Pirellulaceae bacterium SH449]